jgi:Ring finger domain
MASSPEVMSMERCDDCGRMIPAQNVSIHLLTACSGRARPAVGGIPIHRNSDTIDSEGVDVVAAPVDDNAGAARIPAPGSPERSNSLRRRPHSDMSEDDVVLFDHVVVDLSSSSTPENNRHQWTCPRCTLWNPNTEPRCNACHFHFADIPTTGSTRADQPTRAADPTRTERLMDDIPPEPPSPASFLGGGAILGSIIGGAGAYLRGRSVSGGMLEGAMTGAIGGAVAHGVFTSPGGTRHPMMTTNANNDNVSQMRSAGTFGFPSYPSMDQETPRAPRFEPRASLRVIRTNNGGGTVTTVIRRSNGQTTRMVRPGDEAPFMALLMANMMNEGRPAGQNIDNMSYEQLLSAFGDGSENRGAGEDVISSLPSKTIASVEKELPPDFRECSICLDAFEVGCSRKTLPCLHGFHEECVDKWLRTNASCPICKHHVE